MNEWAIYRNNKWLDTVFFEKSMTAPQVKKSLIEHDDFPPDIKVVNKSIKHQKMYIVP